MSEERLELVTRFEDLRAGMLVVDMEGCLACGLKPLRGLLVKYWPECYDTDDDAEEHPGRAWERVPRCCGTGEQFSSVTPKCVASRQIFRVVDPDADASTTTIRELERGK